MRRIPLFFATLAIAAVHPASIQGQEVGETLAVTGCLAAEEDEDGTGFVLENLTGEDVGAAEAELLAAEGVDLSAHVGHTVETTGTVIADEDDADDDAAGEGDDEADGVDDADDGDDAEIHIRVTALRHVAASCPTD